MKIKFLKFTAVFILCIVFLVGCAVSPFLDVTPTPEPTPLSVMDVVIAGYGQIDKAEWYRIKEVLTKEFSLRATYVDLDTAPDAQFDMLIPNYPGVTADGKNHSQDYIDHFNKKGKEYGCIDWREYINDMPNYLSMFKDKDDFYAQFYFRDGKGKHLSYENASDGKIYCIPQVREVNNVIYPVWMYNARWFNKYNYEIPKNIEELVDILIAHKKNYPESTPILVPQSDFRMFGSVYQTLEAGIAATYGVNFAHYPQYSSDTLFKSNPTCFIESLMLKNGELVLAATTSEFISAVSTIKKIYDNKLTDTLSYSSSLQDVENVDDFAVTYLWYHDSIKYYPDGFMLDNDWCVSKNQLTMTDAVNINPSLSLNINASSAPIRALIKDHDDRSAKNELEKRLVSFIDWCCSEEGIITMKYGFEGENYILDENELITNGEKKPTSIIEVLSDSVVSYVSSYEKHLKFTSDEYKVWLKINEAFEGQNINVISNPNPQLVKTILENDDNLSEKAFDILNISKEFYGDFISGVKTETDFASYLAELNNKGLKDVLDGIKDLYDDIHNKGRFVPDSLK